MLDVFTGFQWSGQEGAQTHWTRPGGDSRHCRPVSRWWPFGITILKTEVNTQGFDDVQGDNDWWVIKITRTYAAKALKHFFGLRLDDYGWQFVYRPIKNILLLFLVTKIAIEYKVEVEEYKMERLPGRQRTVEQSSFWGGATKHWAGDE